MTKMGHRFCITLFSFAPSLGKYISKYHLWKIEMAPLLLFASANKKDKHERFYISKKNADIRKIIDGLKVKNPDLYSDILCKYIRLGKAIEDHMNKNNKQSITQIDKTVLQKEYERAESPIPRLDEYHDNGIQGKTIVEAVERKLISAKQATDIIVSAKEIVTEATQTKDMWRYLPQIQSKRDLHRKFKVKKLYTKVKECIEEMFPFSANNYVESHKEYSPDIDENEWEILPIEEKPKYLRNYNLPYNPPS